MNDKNTQNLSKQNKKNSSNPSDESRRRIELLDELRGFAVFGMIFYHAFYIGLAYFASGFSDSAFTFLRPLQPFFASLFIVICGISSRLSRSNFKRGAILLAVAIGFSLVTIFVLPRVGVERAEIRFGILNLLSSSILLFALLRPLLDKINPATGVFACMLLYLLTGGVGKGYLGAPFLRLDLPAALYGLPYLFPLGIYSSDFYSADYFPLLPHVFMFLAGTFLGIQVKNRRLPEFAYKKHAAPLGFMGRHSLVIYIAHAPLLYGIFMLIERAAGR